MEIETREQLDTDHAVDHLGDLVIGRESHGATEAVVIRPDDVQAALRILRDEAEYDHCSCVTAQEYEDRYETIYHLKRYDDPTDEVSVVVPTAKDEPVSRTGASIYRTAEWHEREAYDLIGIRYEDHPNLRRILLPETWQGHPLSLKYDQEQTQIVSLREHANPLQEDHSADQTDTMFLNIGPHHPATHGVLHLKVTLDGEQVADVDPDLGSFVLG